MSTMPSRRRRVSTRVVPAGVVDDGTARPASAACDQRGEDLRHDVRRRHQVDVVAALPLRARASSRASRSASISSALDQAAGRPVLAEDASEVAASRRRSSRSRRCPTSGASSPKCGCQAQTVASDPVRQNPPGPAKRLT